MGILKDLPELVNADIISEETAEKIFDFYKKKQHTNPNRQLLIFGVLGALLVGIGLMFIIANQWDDLPKSVKTVCSFLVLIIPQILCIYILLSKQEKIVWRESTALLLFFAVGANISLVSQIFDINGQASSFVLTWMLLTAPLIYIMNSSSVSLAYFIGIMIYCNTVKFNLANPSYEYIYWLLLIIPLPRYMQQFKKSPDNPLLILHHWVIPFILTQTLGISLSHTFKDLMYPAYMSMFGVLYLIGISSFFRTRTLPQNGFKVFGLAGTVVTLLIMTFKSNWVDLLKSHYVLNDLIAAPEFLANVVLLILASYLLLRQNKDKAITNWKLIEVTYLIFLVLFLIGMYSSISYILVNLFVFVLGLLMIREGSKLTNLGVLNTGMIIIASLIACRSFDSNLSLVFRGILFVLVGIGFFVTNWLMLKKKKENEV